MFNYGAIDKTPTVKQIKAIINYMEEDPKVTYTFSNMRCIFCECMLSSTSFIQELISLSSSLKAFSDGNTCDGICGML